MRFSESDLEAAVAAGVLPAERRDSLLTFLRTRATPTPEASRAAPAPLFDLAHLLWYAGALIVIASMGMFSTIAFAAMGGGALVVTAAVYGLAFVAAGHHVWHGRGLRVPGGLLVAIAVSMVPLAVYGIQDAFDLWGAQGAPGEYAGFYQWIKGSWVFMSVATIVAAVVALRFYPFPFLVFMIAVALWFLSMDLTPWVYGTADFDWSMRRKVSMWFGLGVLAVAWAVDAKPRGGDYAFWLHLFGMMAFWGGLSLQGSDSELAKLVYCLLNVGLLGVAVFLQRRVYAVFGAIGISFYLGHLAYTVFKDSLLFPFALSLVGVAVIALGMVYYRKRSDLSGWMDDNLPPALRRLRPAHAR